MSRNLILAIVLALLVLGAGVAWRYQIGDTTIPPTPEQPATSTGPGAPTSTHKQCLSDDEIVDYPLDPRYAKETRIPKTPLVVIYIKDRATNATLSQFEIDNVAGFAHVIEVHRCGVYVIREVNWDEKKSKPLPGFAVELWRYSYSGQGEKLLTLADLDEKGKYRGDYSYDFRVDDTETYLQLITGILGEPDYALVFRNLKTGKDDFVLKLDDLLKLRPGILPGSFDFPWWSKDRTHLWGDLYIGAYESAYFRIQYPSWKVEVFPPPPGLVAGVERVSNLETGWIAFADIPTFTGGDIEPIWEQARREGRQKNLWVYNLFTEEKLKVASIADPAIRFEAKWLSDTELEYFLPPKERHVYRVTVPKSAE